MRRDPVVLRFPEFFTEVCTAVVLCKVNGCRAFLLLQKAFPLLSQYVLIIDFDNWRSRCEHPESYKAQCDKHARCYDQDQRHVALSHFFSVHFKITTQILIQAFAQVNYWAISDRMECRKLLKSWRIFTLSKRRMTHCTKSCLLNGQTNGNAHNQC